MNVRNGVERTTERTNRYHATGESSESSRGAGASLRTGEVDRDRLMCGSTEDNRNRFSSGSQSGQSEQ